MSRGPSLFNQDGTSVNDSERTVGMNRKAPLILLLGPPGVGKGTYASLLQKSFGMIHVSSGDLLRKAESENLLSSYSSRAMRQGELLDDQTVLKFVKSYLNKSHQASPNTGILLDGFPRRESQIPLLDLFPWYSFNFALLLKMREDVLIEKLVARRICSNNKCGRGYNIANIQREGMNMPALNPLKPDICDSCGSPLIQRDDDTFETVRRRIDLHKRLSENIESYYRDIGKLEEFTLTSGIDEMWPVLKEFFQEAVSSHSDSSV